MANQKTFECSPDGFKINGKESFLSSGEIHYFRIPPSKWALHLRRLKEAGCKAVTTYVPWDWHEYRQGKFDFTGATEPRRNLLRFIDLTKRYGLFLVIKPGPYILAEYSGHGLPHWLIKRYPGIRAIDRNGRPSDNFIVTLLHPTFLKFTKRWYKKIGKIAARHQVSNGGNIIMMQVCNEIGVFYWLANEADYSPVAMRHYRGFIKGLYKGDVSELNRLYKTGYKDFSDVEPSYGHIKDKYSLLRDMNWHGFWRWYYAEYINNIRGFIREAGVDLQLYHNIPGWQFGRATPYLMNLSMYEEFVERMPDVMLAIDHLPENMTYRNFHDAAICDHSTASMQKGRFPVYVAEMQVGSREHGVVTYPDELELFYKSVLMRGARGFNYYMFSQGINPPGKGFFGPTFYWQVPLNNDGSKSRVYNTIKKVNKLADTHMKFMSRAASSPNIAFTYYRPYFRWELIRSMELNGRIPRYSMKMLNEYVFSEGMVKAAQIMNMDFRIEDLLSTDIDNLCGYKQLWVIFMEYMDKDTQSKLVEYVERGGHLVALPTLPGYDLNFKRCGLLAKSLGVDKVSAEHIADPRISFMDIEEMFVINPINILSVKKPFKPIARTLDGRICGVEKKIGKGKVTILGTAFGHQVAEHISGYRQLLNEPASARRASATNKYISVSGISAEDHGYLFVSNHHNMSIDGKVTFTNPGDGKSVTFPERAALSLPPIYGFISPINLKFETADERILYSTSDITGMAAADKYIKVNLDSRVGLDNEIVILTKRKARKVSLNSGPAAYTQKKGKLTITYTAVRCNNELLVTF